MLARNSIDIYFNYLNDLNHQSTLLGRAMINIVSRDIMELGQITDTFRRNMILPHPFSEGITPQNTNAYFKYLDCTDMDSREVIPIDNVPGDYFRELIEKHSDFSIATIKKYEKISKTFFAVALGESIYEMATADDKWNKAGELASSWLAAEGGSFLGMALCGAAAPFWVVAGAGLVGGAAAVVTTQKAWNEIFNEPPRPFPDNFELPSLDKAAAFFKPSLPSLKNTAAFFQPAERLQRPNINGDGPQLLPRPTQKN